VNGGSLMQYLKEDVKDRIIASALQEFKEKGYINSSIRTIAKNAGIASGNVYRYFESKDELFNKIIDPVHNQLMSYISDIEKANYLEANIYCHPMSEINQIKNMIMDIFKDYSTELLILIDNSKGTKYENIKRDLILFIDGILKKTLILELKQSNILLEDDFITYVMSSSLVDGICLILRKYEDGVRVKALIDQLLIIFFKDMTNRFK
jgi:sugar-specific transcriptional regulator TrmB